MATISDVSGKLSNMFSVKSIVSGITKQLQEITMRLQPLNILSVGKYSLQGTTQGRYLTGGVPPVRFSM